MRSLPSGARAQVPAIHATAIVEPGAKLGVGTVVGPYSIIGANVELGADAVVHAHVVIGGHTSIGAGVEIFPYAAVGLRPQDRKHDGTPTRLLIGDRTVIRECVTVQPGAHAALSSGGITQIGRDCLIMAYAHVAHDVSVGDNVIIANATQIAGHCVLEDHAILGGATTVHQFVRIGTHAITGAATRLQQDVPPYMLADGNPARLFGLNAIGLKRAQFSSECIRALKRAYRDLFLSARYKEALRALETGPALDWPEVDHLCRFIRLSQRGIVRANLKQRRRRPSCEPGILENFHQRG